MEFRRSKKEDIEEIMAIINMAKNYLKEEGIDQWQKGYPNSDVIEKDIDDGYSYVLTDGGDLVGTTYLSFDGEELYNTIDEGQWLNHGDYGVIHRIAVDRELKRKGLASRIVKEVEDICMEKNIKSIKIDTHRKNIVMQNFLRKNGFEYCGIIYLVDGDERLAFEKLL